MAYSTNGSERLRDESVANLLGLYDRSKVECEKGKWDSITVITLMQREDKELITTRLTARAAKNWAESDRIRDELAAMGVALKDNKDGTTTWEVKR